MRSFLASLAVVGIFAFVASAAEKVDRAKTTVSVKSHPNGFQLIIVPRDKSGDRLGPGYASKFNVTVRSGSASAPADPASDGTYMITISGVSDSDPQVTVTFDGVPLDTGFVPPRRKHH